MFQSRQIPFRHHTLSSTSLQVPSGRYAGRVVEVDETSSSRRIALLLEDQCLWGTPASNESTPPLYSLIAFDWDESQSVSNIEVLQTSITTSAQEDVLRWRAWGQESRMQNLRIRHQALQAVRSIFDRQGFLEVQTPLLVPTANPEHQFDLFQTPSGALITSPEFHMKRMLVGGFEKIYQMGSVFRGKEVGAFHNPEFMLLEWYRAYDRLESCAKDLETLVQTVALTSPHYAGGHLMYQETSIDLKSPWKAQTVSEVFRNAFGFDTHDICTVEELQKQAYQHGHAKLIETADPTFESVFFHLWDHIQPQLGLSQPLFVHDWPKPLASLAQTRVDQPTVVERLELYIGGLELANGFGELCDPQEQRQRFEAEQVLRKERAEPEVMLDEKFLDALGGGMPPSAGMALGVDRLIMLLANASHIRDVLCFDWQER